MLYSPKWEVKADPFALTSLVAWLERQPADEHYDYYNCAECPIALLFKASGYQRVAVNGFNVSFDGDCRSLPPHFDKITAARPHTYGAALARARALLGGAA